MPRFSYMVEYHTLDALEDPEFKELFEQKRSELESEALKHVRHMIACKHNGIDLNEPCFLQPEDPDFQLPSPEMVGRVVELLQELNSSGETGRKMGKDEISEMLGLSVTGSNRTLNRWLKPGTDKQINKSNWCVIAAKAGLMQLTVRKNKPISHKDVDSKAK